MATSGPSVWLNIGPGVTYYPYINFFKTGTGFGDALSNPLGNFTANGTPVVAPPDDKLGVGLRLPPSYSGDYVLKWSAGNGGFLVNVPTGSYTFVSSTGGTYTSIDAHNFRFNATGSTARIRITLTGEFAPILYFSSTATYSGLNIEPIFCRLDQEAAYDSGEIFNPDYITALRTLNPHGIRVMQEEQVITGRNRNSKPYTYMRPENYINWIDAQYPLGAIAGGTTQLTRTQPGGAGTQEIFTCTAGTDHGGALADGDMLIAYNVSANTGTDCVLKIGSRSAVKILDRNFGGGPIVDSLNIEHSTLTANSVVVFVYNQFANAFSIYNEIYYGVIDGPGLSVYVKLANKIGCGLWYCLPTFCTDAEAVSVAQYVDANLASGQPGVIEYTNEIWNGGTDPRSTGLNLNAYVADNPSEGGSASWATFRHRSLMKAITTVIPGIGQSGSRLKRAFAWQQGNLSAMAPWLTGTTLTAWGDGYPATGGTNRWNTNGFRPIDFTDILSSSDYKNGPFTPCFKGNYYLKATQQALYDNADLYASGNPTSMAAAIQWVDDDLRGVHNGTGNPDDQISQLSHFISTDYPDYESAAASYDTYRTGVGQALLEVHLYEGGLQIGAHTEGPWVSASTLQGLPGLNSTDAAIYGGSPDLTGATGRIPTLFQAYKNSALFKKFVQDSFTAFYAAGPHMKRSVYYTFLQDDGTNWSMHPGDLYSTPYQSFDAVAQWDSGAGYIQFAGPLCFRMHA